MTVVSARKKSSAVSVSIFPELSLRASAPSKPSGFPVVKKNGAAEADVARPMPAAVIIADANFIRKFTLVLLSWVDGRHSGKPDCGAVCLDDTSRKHVTRALCPG